jgi:DNA-binding NarL/FixJ family response regulator
MTMDTRRPKVLLVDDEENLVLALHRVLYQDNDRYDVLLARTAEIAQGIVAELPIDVIVTDVHLPDRSGMDLLSWAALSCPHTRVIVMTAFDVDGIRARAHAFGCLRLVRKPFDVHEMRAAVLSALDQHDGFAGTLAELSAVDVIQMLCVARKTTAVRFSEEASSGAVYLEHGEPVHAVWDDLVGEDAFYRMVAVRSGAFHTAPLPPDIERSLPGNWQYLLMEGTRRLDEAARRREGSGEPPCPEGRPTLPSALPRPATWPPAGRRRSAAPPPLRELGADVSLLVDEGFAQLRAGRRDDARAAWEKALRLDPGNRLIELNLRKLGRAQAPVVASR